MSQSIKLVETWFAEHHGDGDFAREPHGVPYALIGPALPTAKIIFTTKPKLVARAIELSRQPERYGLIGRYGLPNTSDLKWIRRMAGGRKLLFLGDLDVVDLLVFCWLRMHLGGNKIGHWGISDSFLVRRRISISSLANMAFSPAEQLAFPLVERVFPEFGKVVGTRCAAVLKRRRKIELEAVVSRLGTVEGLLPPAR